jgi:hypothetical protein
MDSSKTKWLLNDATVQVMPVDATELDNATIYMVGCAVCVPYLSEKEPDGYLA